MNVSAGLILTDTVHHKSSFPGNGVKEITHANLHNDMDDPSSIAIETSENSEMGRKTSSFAQASFTDHFTEISPADAPIEQKVLII